ncbi:MAG: sporulation protein YabP [Clostridiales bacterium]|nr:sporulation protein YabP [Clostridiales bacterium]
MGEEKNSNLLLENRKHLTISGAIEVIAFDEEKIILSTKLGRLDIKGEGLKINKLDVQNGDVTIIGTLNSMIYSTKNVNMNKKNILKRLFQ